MLMRFSATGVLLALVIRDFDPGVCSNEREEYDRPSTETVKGHFGERQKNLSVRHVW